MAKKEELMNFLLGNQKENPVNNPDKKDKLFNYLTTKDNPTDNVGFNFESFGNPSFYPKFNEQVRLLGYGGLTTDASKLNEKFVNAQSIQEKAWRGIKGFGEQAAGGFLMSLGANFDFEMGLNVIAGTEDEYDNWFLNTGAKLVEDSQKGNNTIYESSPGKVNFSDPGWWLNQFKSSGLTGGIAAEAMAETALVSLLTGGTGTAGAITKAAGSLNKLEKALNATKLLRKTKYSNMLWAGLRRNGESVMEAYFNFHETESELKAKRDAGIINLSDDEIKKIAADAAADTYRGNIPLVVFDLITANALSINPVTKGVVSGQGFIEKGLSKIKSPILRKLGTFGVTGLSEGMEEFFQYGIAEEAKYGARTKSGLQEEVPVGERIGGYLTSDEGWNNFWGGVIGAGVLGGGSRMVHKGMELINNNSYVRQQKDFVKDMVNTGREIQERIRYEEEQGNPDSANELRRILGFHKALKGLELDRLTGKTKSFDAYTSFLNDMITTLNSGDEEELKKNNIEDVEANTKMYQQYIADANKIKKIYESVAESNLPNAISKITAAKFSTEILTQKENELKGKINEIKSTDNTYNELTPKGKQIFDVVMNIDKLTERKKKLQEKINKETNVVLKMLAKDELRQIENGIKAHNLEYNNLLAEDDSRTEKEKDKDVDKIKILRATNISSLEYELGEVEARKEKDEKTLAKWSDKRFQTKDFVGVTNKQINNLNTLEEVKGYKKSKAYNFLSEKKKKKLEDKERKLKSNATVEKEVPKPVVKATEDLADKHLSKEQKEELTAMTNAEKETPVTTTQTETLGNTFEKTFGVASKGPSKESLVFTDEGLSDEDFTIFEPSDEEFEQNKETFKGHVKKLHDAYKSDLKETPSFESLIRRLLQTRTKEEIKPYFDAIYFGWKANGYKLEDNEYDKTYDLFSDFGAIFDDLVKVHNLTKSEKETERKNPVQNTNEEELKTEENKPVIPESGDTGYEETSYKTISNTGNQASYLNQEVENIPITNEVGEVIGYERKTKYPGQLFKADDLYHERIMNPDFKEGDKLTLGLPNNDSFLITMWEDGKKQKPITYGELKTMYEEGSEDFIRLVPILAYDKEGYPVFQVHTPGWYNKINMGSEMSPERQAQLIKENIEGNLNLRHQFWNSGNTNNERSLEIVITEKEHGYFDITENKIPLNQANPQALLGRAISEKQLQVYNEKGEAFTLTLNDDNIIRNTDFVKGHMYDVRLAFIKPGKNGNTIHKYVVLEVDNTDLSEQRQLNVYRMVATFLNVNSTNEKNSKASVKVTENYKKETGHDLSTFIGFSAALRENIMTNTVDIDLMNKLGKMNDHSMIVDHYVKNEGRPFILLIPSSAKKEPTIIFGIKGKEFNGENHLFIKRSTLENHPETAASLLDILRKEVLPKFSNNASFTALQNGKKVFDIGNKGEVTESKSSTGETSYMSHLKDTFVSRVVSHNVGTEENPIYATMVQPRVMFDVVGEAKGKIKKIEKNIDTGEVTGEVKKEVVTEEKTTDIRDDINEAIRQIGLIGGKANELNNLFNKKTTLKEPLMMSQSQILNALSGFTANIQGLSPIEEDILTEHLMQTILEQLQTEENTNVEYVTGKIKEKFDELITQGKTGLQNVLDKLQTAYDSNTELYFYVEPILNELRNGLIKYDNIEASWNKLVDLTINKIQKNTNLELTDDANEEKESYDSFDYGKNSFEVNYKSSVSKELKTFFSGVRLKDKEGNYLTGFMNVPLYSKLDETWDTVEQIISSQEPDSSFKEMVDNLKYHTYAYPWLEEFIDKLEKAPEHIKNEFTYEMTKHVLSMKFIMYSKKNGKYTTRVYSTNSADLKISIIRNWMNNAKNPDNGLVDYINGEYIVNKEKAKELLNEYNNWISSEPVLNLKIKGNERELSDIVTEKKENVTLTFDDITLKNKKITDSAVISINDQKFKFVPIDRIKGIYSVSYLKPKVDTESFVKWLRHFGIQVSENTIDEIKAKGMFVSKGKKTKPQKFESLLMVPKGEKSTNIFGLLTYYLNMVVSNEGPVSFDDEGNETMHPLKLISGNLLEYLAKIDIKYNKYNVTKSFRDNKKGIYGFTATKFATDRIKKLKNDKAFLLQKLSTPFSKHSMLLQLMRDEDTISESIQIDHLGLTSIKEMYQPVYKDTKIDKLSPYDMRAVRAGLFFDTQQGNISYEIPEYGLKMRMARMIIPLAPDKTGAVMLNMPVFDFVTSDLFNKNGVMELSNKVREVVYKQLILPELERIINHIKLDSPTGIKNYDEAAGIFTQFPLLNEIKYEEKTVLEYLHDSKGKSKEELISFFEKVFKSQAIDTVEANIIGLTGEKAELFRETFVRPSKDKDKKGENELRLIDEGYFKEGRNPSDIKSRILTAAADFTVNSVIANANFYMSIIGDPAFFSDSKKFEANFEKNEEGKIDVSRPLSDRSYMNVIKDLDEKMGKRLAMLIAPRKILANSKGRTYRQIFLQDALDVSENIEYLVSLVEGNYPNTDKKYVADTLKLIRETKDDSIRKAKIKEIAETFSEIADYFNIESTDAQEYVTLREAAYVKFHKGQMTEDVYNSIMKKAEDQRKAERENKPIPENVLLSSEEKKIILGPEKPVHTGEVYDSKNNIMRLIYIKSSAVPLIPEFTVGREIDKLRRAMEDFEDNPDFFNKEGGNNFVRASYQTANKVGAVKRALPIFNKEKVMNISQEDMYESSLLLNREDFGIQQEVPYDEEKDKISIGTQAAKLLFGDGVMNMTGFKYKGEPEGITGKQLYDKYNETFEKLILLKKANLYREMGIDMVTNMPVNVDETMKKVNDILVKEAKSRNFPKQDIEALKLIEITDRTADGRGMEFKLPLWSAANSDRYESMLLSIVRKRLINIKLPGSSFAAMSESGFSYVDDIQQLDKRYTNKMIYTSGWNGKELQAFVNDNGSYHAQIMMPSKFRDNEGNLIDLFKKDGSTYMYVEKSENGWKLKDGMISKELLQLFSFRIPTSGHMSMSTVEIVGILPNKMGDVILLPKNFTKKMGLDFDIDKQYHYNLWSTVNDDGSIVPLTDEDQQEKLLENDFVNIHKIVLSHPSVQKIHNKVLSTEEERKQSNIINDKLNSELDDSNFTFLSDEYQADKILSGASGGLAIGIYSNYVVLHSLIQQAVEKGNDIYLYGKEDKKEYVVEIALGGQKSEGKFGGKDSLGDGRSISEILGSLQNTALDNLKLGILGKTNINDITINAATLLTLLGFDKTKDAVELTDGKKEHLFIPYLFTSQPVIRDYVKMMKNSKATFEDYDADKEEKIIAKLQAIYNFSMSDVNIDKLSNVTGQNLYDNLTSPSSDVQGNIFALFMMLKNYGDSVTGFQSLFNVNKSGAGKSMFEAFDKYEKLSNSDSVYGFKNLESLIGDYSSQEKEGYVRVGESTWIKPTTITGNMIVHGITSAYNLWSPYFPYNTKSFRKIYGDVITELGLEDASSQKTTEIREELFKELRKFLNSTSIGTFNGNPDDERKRLFLEKNGKSLPNYINTIKLEKNNEIVQRFIKENPLVNSLTTDIRKKEYFSTLEYNNTGSNAIQEEYKYKSLLDLLDKPHRLPDFNYTESTFYDELDIANSGLSEEILENIENDIQKGLILESPLSESESNKPQYKSLLDLLEGQTMKFSYKGKSYKITYKGFMSAEDIINETSLGTENISSRDVNIRHFVYEIEPFYTTRDLARDLITYAYLEGGIQEAIQFVKYVPVSVLDSLGFSQNMRNFHNKLKNEEINIERFVRQYFQHNPGKVTKINEETELPLILKQQNKRNKEEVTTFSMTGDMPYTRKYVAMRNSSAKIGPKYFLFENDGTGVFNRITTLGEFGMSEYNYNNDKNNSILKEPNIKEVPKKLKNPVQDILNKINDKRLKAVIEEYMSSEKEGFKSVLTAFNDYLDKDLTIEITTEKVNGNYSFEENKFKINEERLYKNKNKIPRIFLHELSHAATVKYLKKYFKLNKNYESVPLIPVNEMPVHIKKLYWLFEEAVKKVKGSEKYKDYYTSIKEKVKQPVYTTKNSDEKVAYGVTNIFEFIPAIMFDKQFIEDIGDLPYKDTETTLVEKFKEWFNEFLKIIGVKEDTLREHAIDSLFSFLEEEKRKEEGLTETDMEAQKKLDEMNSHPDPVPPMEKDYIIPQSSKNHSMYYKMPAKDNLTGKDTSTLELAEQGLRTATTRSYPLGKVGDIITFEGRPQEYKITNVEQLTEDKVKDSEWIKQWSQKEQWTEDHFKEVLGGKTVHVGSYQTSFEKITNNKEINIPNENNKFVYTSNYNNQLYSKNKEEVLRKLEMSIKLDLSKIESHIKILIKSFDEENMTIEDFVKKYNTKENEEKYKIAVERNIQMHEEEEGYKFASQYEKLQNYLSDINNIIVIKEIDYISKVAGSVYYKDTKLFSPLTLKDVDLSEIKNCK